MCNLKCSNLFLSAPDQMVMNHVPKFYLLVFVNLEIFVFDPYSLSFPLISQNLVQGCQYIFYQTVQLQYSILCSIYSTVYLCCLIATASKCLTKFMKTIYFVSHEFCSNVRNCRGSQLLCFLRKFALLLTLCTQRIMHQNPDRRPV